MVNIQTALLLRNLSPKLFALPEAERSEDEKKQTADLLRGEFGMFEALTYQ